MRVAGAAALIVVGMYIFALYGPRPFTTRGLLWGIAIIFGLVFAAYYVWCGPDWGSDE